jgi:hypothetical protein
MFVTQPPCKSVTVELSSIGYRDTDSLRFEHETGIKMGELYDFINDEMSYHLNALGVSLPSTALLPKAISTK